MLQFIYKNLLTLNSTILFVFIYIVKSKVYIKALGVYSIVLYILAILLLTVFCLLGTRMLADDTMEGNIQEVSTCWLISYRNYCSYICKRVV